MDIMGNLAKGPESKLTDASFQVKRLQPVGGYAVQILWQDGHNAGLYSHEYLRSIGEKTA